MDFRVTHFLVADGVSSQTTLAALENAKLAAFEPNGDSTNTPLSTITNGQYFTKPFQLVQGLDRTDAIQKELGVIKSGVINPSKIVSVRKLVGTSMYTRQFKVFGTSTLALNPDGSTSTVFPAGGNTVTAGTYYHIVSGNHLFYCLVGGTTTGSASASGLSVGDLYTTIGGVFVYLGAIYASGSPTALVPSVALALPGTSATAKAGTLEFESDKEYSFSVRVRSAKANSISPFGITRGYAAMASNTYVNPNSGAAATSDIYAPFSTLFNLVKNFGADTMLTEFAKVESVIYSCAATNGTVTDTVYFTYNPTSGSTVTSGADANAPVSLTLYKGSRAVTINTFAYTTWHEALAAAQALVSGFYPVPSQTVVAGATYTASILVEAKEQTNFALNYAAGVSDPTAFPYKWDVVRLNGFFHEGPYGKTYDWYSTNAINAGVSTQTPITFDQTQSGAISVYTLANVAYTVNSKTVAANYVQLKYASSVYSPITEVKFPNLMKEEVRHIAHQYQSYSLKYKQQFRSPRYNAMVMDPYQSKITAAGPYTLYYIEYMPEVDTSYTSTQPMTNLTIVATADATLITQLDYAFASELVETAG